MLINIVDERMTMVVKRVATVLVTIVCLVGISGCSNAATVAATVDDMVITEASIKQASDAMYEILSQNSSDFDENELNATMVQHRLSGAIVAKVAPRLGVTITNEEREAVWNQEFGLESNGGLHPLHPLWADPRSHEAIAGWIDSALMSWMIQTGKIDGQQFFAEVEKVHIVLNPRYGEFDYEIADMAATKDRPGGSLAELVDFSKKAK